MIVKYKYIIIGNILLYLSIVLCFQMAMASERAKVVLPEATFPSFECVVDAARTSGIPLAALVGLLATEGGQPGEALGNTNGTWDLGPFQINTCHVNELVTMGIAPEAVLQSGCVGAYAAAWLLRKEYNRTGDIWEAVGAYHSRTLKRRDAYIAKVKENLLLLQQQGVFILPLEVAR